MKVAVTGGSGVVGSSVIRHLIDAGHHVIALARSGDSGTALEAMGTMPVMGDVLDRDALDVLVEGAEWVFHIAGINEMCSLDPDRLDLVNIEGTRNVMEASRAAGVGRLIHTSSAATIGEQHGTVGTESSRHRGSYHSRYERSKHLSELVLFEEAGDLDVVSVNPSSVQGPGRATGTGKLFLDVLNGRMPFLVDTSVSIVDIDDCAAGHLLAASEGVRGQRYILSGASLDMRRALSLLSEVTSRDLSPLFLPGWIASAGVGVAALGARAMGRRPKLCREMVAVLLAGHVYDGSRATRDLGLEYRPLELTIRRTVDWFEAEGLMA